MTRQPQRLPRLARHHCSVFRSRPLTFTKFIDPTCSCILKRSPKLFHHFALRGKFVKSECQTTPSLKRQRFKHSFHFRCTPPNRSTRLSTSPRFEMEPSIIAWHQQLRRWRGVPLLEVDSQPGKAYHLNFSPCLMTSPHAKTLTGLASP